MTDPDIDQHQKVIQEQDPSDTHVDFWDRHCDPWAAEHGEHWELQHWHLVVQRLKAGSCVSSLNMVSFFHIGSETTVYTECEGVADGTLATCILGMIAGCRSCISAQMWFNVKQKQKGNTFTLGDSVWWQDSQSQLELGWRQFPSATSVIVRDICVG